MEMSRMNFRLVLKVASTRGVDPLNGKSIIEIIEMFGKFPRMINGMKPVQKI